MVTTRKQSSTRKQIYRSRVKNSTCRKIKRTLVCKRSNSCKYASGKKRSFCRKSKNARVTM